MPHEPEKPASEDAVDAVLQEEEIAGQGGRDKRRYPRYSAPLTIEINGNAYPALDWSLSGFRIGEVRDLGLAGEKVTAKIVVFISEFEFRFEAVAELVRLDPAKREAAFSFRGLSPEEIRALGFISSAYLSGRLKNVDGLLRNVSASSSSTSEEEVDRAIQLGRRKVWVRRGVFAALAVVAILSARAAILTMTSVSSAAAWVDVRMVEMSTPEPAVVQEIFAVEGTSLQPGDAIARLSNRQLEAELANAQADKRVLEARLDGLRGILEGRSTMLQAEAVQARQARQLAESRRAEVLQSLEAARAHAARLREQSVPGIVSLGDRARAEQAVAEIAERLSLAERAVDDAEARMAAATSGFFVGDARSTGFEPATLRLEIAEIEEQIGAASVNIAGLTSRLSELSLVSPCNCEVNEVLLLPGERTATHQPVLRLVAVGDTQTVSAFVKHADARRLKIGQRTVVHLADGRRDSKAVITDISTTIRLSSEERLFSRDLNPERYAQLTIQLSDEYSDAPGAAVETTIHWPFLRWLANMFQL